MIESSRYPSLYQINTRVWLRSLGRALSRPVTLADVPDAELDRIASHGFDWVWLLSVWRTSAASRAISRSNPGWLAEFRTTLPDLDPETDIPGSGFAIEAYRVADSLGGPAALAEIRKRLSARGLKLMLDHVPNHTGLDHPWLADRPDFFIRASDEDLARQPQNFVRAHSADGEGVFAHGRDPYFDGWPDTLQLNYGNPELQEARIAELLAIADQCDGVRCDMAMLILPEVFRQTWGVDISPFWPRAITAVRAKHPSFAFMAEVYWDLEWTLQQQGFDYCYDKRLYDRLHEGHAGPVRDHLVAPLDYQDHLARFLENHDEARAAATFSMPQHRAAAAITYLTPGLRFFHEGQLEGRRVRISPHLSRGPDEPIDADVSAFYARLLALLRDDVLRAGHWQRLDTHSAWDGNDSHKDMIAMAWDREASTLLLVVANFSGTQSQCRVALPFERLGGRKWRLACALTDEIYQRSGEELRGSGIYVEQAPWQVNAFRVSPL